MYSIKRSSANKDVVQIPKPQVGNSSSRKRQKRGESSSSRTGLVRQNGPLHRPTFLGLLSRETWQLRDSIEDDRKGCQICNEGKRLCNPWNRCRNLAKESQDEERSIVRISRQVDAGRRYFGSIRRSTSRYGREELAKAGKVPTILTIEEEESSSEGIGDMEGSGYWPDEPGFSDIGSVAQQEPEWFTQTHENETTLAMGKYQSWEDYLGSEFDEDPSDILGSDECSSSG